MAGCGLCVYAECRVGICDLEIVRKIYYTYIKYIKKFKNGGFLCQKKRSGSVLSVHLSLPY